MARSAQPRGAALGDSPRSARGTQSAVLGTRLLADRYRALLLLLFLLSLPFVTHRVYASDEVQYFAYLHSVGFDRDLDFTNEYSYFISRYPDSLAGLKQTNLDRIAANGQRVPSLTDLPINFAPIGTALLWAPFYAVGHLAALLLHAIDPAVAADGYSAPYLWAITTGSAIYAAAGLLLLHRLARRYVDEAAAFWATLGTWLGTPVVFYSHGAPAYSHAASIFAVTIFLATWQATRPLTRRPGWAWAALGALAALTTMVREQDGIIPVAVLGAEAALTLPTLLRGRDWRSLGGLIGGGLLMLLAWAAALTPQIAAYCILNGNCRPNQNVTDKVSSFVPGWAFGVMLDPQYGLIFWTPIVVPALLGLAWLWRRDRTLTLALALILLATWYVSAVYNTGPTRGSFGARRFLNCTPVFLLGLAGAYQTLRERRLAPLVPLLTLLGMWWNLGLIVQFAFRLMDRQRLELDRILANQFTVVPSRLLAFARGLLFDRASLFRNP